MNAREAAPEKALMRDYIDARFNLGEFLLPSRGGDPGRHLPELGTGRPSPLIATLAMYVFILAVIVDGFLMWRGFKKVLAERLPKASTQGPADVRDEPQHPDPPLPDAAAPVKRGEQY